MLCLYQIHFSVFLATAYCQKPTSKGNSNSVNLLILSLILNRNLLVIIIMHINSDPDDV
jgi:hypothetical protein